MNNARKPRALADDIMRDAEAMDAEAARTPADAEPYQAEHLAALAARVAESAARLAGGQYRPPYNGWTNAESWRVFLWLTNDQDTYNTARAIVAEADDDIDAADALRAYVEDLPDIARATEDATLAADLLGAALAWTNWREIAEALAE